MCGVGRGVVGVTCRDVRVCAWCRHVCLCILQMCVVALVQPCLNMGGKFVGVVVVVCCGGAGVVGCCW